MHNLSFNEKTGKFSFFSTQQKAWHGLGQIVDEYPTSGEAIRFAGLDFNVKKLPNVHPVPGFGELVSGESYFTYRTDNGTVLGASVGKDYEIVQNQDAFTFFDEIAGGQKGMLYETAGALGKGERIFITAKLPDYIRVGHSDDVLEQYIFLTNSHDATGSITAAFTPVRIVCNNTLNHALRNMTNVVRIRHTANAKQRLMSAQKIMGITHKLETELQEIFTNWSTVRITDKQVKRLIELALCPNKETLAKLEAGEEISANLRNQADSAFAYAMTAESQQMETAKGTLFGAYNAVTGYFQNVKSYKTAEDKTKSIIYGGTAQNKGQKAFDLCNTVATKGTDILMLN